MARHVNTNLADYLVSVNAHVGDVQAIFVSEEDTTINLLAIRTIGEIGNVGFSATVANAVYHATGNATGKRLGPAAADRLSRRCGLTKRFADAAPHKSS